MQSSLAPPAPPYLHMKFATFEDAKENYRSYAKFHGFAVYTDHRKKLIKTGEYNRAELRCFKSRKNKKKRGEWSNHQRSAKRHHGQNELPCQNEAERRRGLVGGNKVRGMSQP